MTSTAFLFPLKCNGLTSFSSLSFSPRKFPRNAYAYLHSHSKFSYQKSSISRNLYSFRLRESSIVAVDAKTSESGEGENEALDAVLRLYSAIKNKNYEELSEILADECRCVCNFLSFFQAFHGKTQVLEFFSYLIKIFGGNFQIVVKPTMQDGMQVGVQWRFESNKIHVPLGKGFSFHICQTYQGRAVIRNIEMFMEPLLHLEPLRLKMMASLTAFTDKIGSLMRLDSGNKAIKISSIVLALLSISVLLFLILTSKKALP